MNVRRQLVCYHQDVRQIGLSMLLAVFVDSVHCTSFERDFRLGTGNLLDCHVCQLRKKHGGDFRLKATTQMKNVQIF